MESNKQGIVNPDPEWILWETPLQYICRDCGYEGHYILLTALDRERTDVRCPKCGSYRVHVPLDESVETRVDEV